MESGLAVIVSGGPAPGINSVISASVIEARKRNWEVFGANDGFSGLALHGAGALRPLDINDVSRIGNTGGSILGTSRFNPFAKPEYLLQLHQAFTALRIRNVIVIGGEGSAYLSAQLSRAMPEIRTVHVPKTIDNDLVLPNNHPSFGFETARHVGTEILNTLMEDARTTKRWFLVTSMGRRAGFLALGLGVASSATLTLIPEEFTGANVRVRDVAAIISGSILSRHQHGKPYGVAIVAEGILDRLDTSDEPSMKSLARDDLGRLRYADAEVGDILRPLVVEQLGQTKIRIVTKNIGYELRCHAPVSFDIEYTRFLGFAAVELLAQGHGGVLVSRDFDRIHSQPLTELLTPDGDVRSRSVDLNSDLYRMARRFMIRGDDLT